MDNVQNFDSYVKIASSKPINSLACRESEGVLPCSQEHDSVIAQSINFQRTTRRCILRDIALHNHRFEDLKSYIAIITFAHQSLK
jgi:hypothetical protein